VALNLLAGGREDQFAAAAGTLNGEGDYALALEIIQPGLLRQLPGNTASGRSRRKPQSGTARRRRDPPAGF
jgi:hypothetical protein